MMSYCRHLPDILTDQFLAPYKKQSDSTFNNKMWTCSETSNINTLKCKTSFQGGEFLLCGLRWSLSIFLVKGPVIRKMAVSGMVLRFEHLESNIFISKHEICWWMFFHQWHHLAKVSYYPIIYLIPRFTILDHTPYQYHPITLSVDDSAWNDSVDTRQYAVAIRYQYSTPRTGGDGIVWQTLPYSQIHCTIGQLNQPVALQIDLNQQLISLQASLASLISKLSNEADVTIL